MKQPTSTTASVTAMASQQLSFEFDDNPPPRGTKARSRLRLRECSWCGEHFGFGAIGPYRHVSCSLACENQYKLAMQARCFAEFRHRCTTIAKLREIAPPNVIERHRALVVLPSASIDKAAGSPPVKVIPSQGVRYLPCVALGKPMPRSL